MSETHDFLRALYSGTDRGYLAIWNLKDKGTHWFPVDHLDDAASCASELSGTSDVYFGIGLQPRDLGGAKRGTKETVICIPGLWLDIDVSGPAHKAPNLPPTIETAMDLVAEFPLKPTLVLHSGHGLQVWWLFRKPWMLETDEEREKAQQLSKHFQCKMQNYAATHGWQIDNTSDLARVLRLPATWNRKHKLEPVQVRVMEQDLSLRYEPNEFEKLLAHTTVRENPPEPKEEEAQRELKPAQWEPIVEGCTWIHHCRRDAATLPEPEWYGMLSIAGRCQNHERLVHELSRPHPGYSKDETSRKLQQALTQAGPRTCDDIRNNLNGELYCTACPHWGRLKSPIVLGDSGNLSRRHSETIRRVGAYAATAKGLNLIITKNDSGEVRPLTNFDARIVSDIEEDDGAEKRHVFEIEATVHGVTKHIRVLSNQFGNMNWAIEQLGVRAIIFPGQAVRDHVRTAIQTLSGDANQRTVYAHIGWREINGHWYYLHAGGAVGATGSVKNIEVRVPEIPYFSLPEPPQDQRRADAIRATLKMLDVAPDRVSIPLLAGAFRAPLAKCDFAIYLHGRTGAGKSELAALMQQHYGREMNGRNLPGSFLSTGNSTEMLSFKAKDAVLVIDDFVPTGGQTDISRSHAQADRIFRAQGNHSGRQRMRPDGTLAPVKKPRGLQVGTGEDVPRGQSLAGRLFLVEVRPDDVRWDKLTICQNDAAEGRYAETMAAFLQWLASHYEQVRKELQHQLVELREKATQATGHKRTPQNVADLALGLRWFLRFAVESGAISAAESQKFWDRGWAALQMLGGLQQEHQQANDPVRRFVEVLSAALGSGEAHAIGTEGQVPQNAPAWGWRRDRDGWKPYGKRIGWVDADDVYLNADIAYEVVQAQLRASGESIPVSIQTLKRHLRDRKWIKCQAEHRERGEITRCDVQKTIEGHRMRVLWMQAKLFGHGPIDQSVGGPTYVDAVAA